jgi:hypothetical protein
MTSALDPRHALFTALMPDRLAPHLLEQRAQAVELRSEACPISRLQVLNSLIVMI